MLISKSQNFTSFSRFSHRAPEFLKKVIAMIVSTKINIASLFQVGFVQKLCKTFFASVAVFGPKILQKLKYLCFNEFWELKKFFENMIEEICEALLKKGCK